MEAETGLVQQASSIRDEGGSAKSPLCHCHDEGAPSQLLFAGAKGKLRDTAVQRVKPSEKDTLWKCSAHLNICICHEVTECMFYKGCRKMFLKKGRIQACAC